MAEALAVLERFSATAAAGGPGAEQPALFWVEVDPADDEGLRQRAARLGYVDRIERVERLPPARSRGRTPQTWRGRPYRLELVWQDSAEEHRQAAPDRRQFFLRADDGEVRAITGYRGGSGRGERRALPVADARLLINLARADAGRVVLDPFAGAGGIVVEAVRVGAEVWSIDVDGALGPGLTSFGARHTVGSATSLALVAGSADAVATEPPFDDESTEIVVAAIAEIQRVLRPGGRAALMVGARQLDAVVAAGVRCGLTVELAEPVDRRGTAVAVLLLEKTAR